MTDLLQKVSAKYVKPEFTDVQAGDSVRVFTTVKEGSKTRSQFFEGIVLRRRGGIGSDATFTVRRIASGVGVERTFALHSPVIEKIEVRRAAKVRRAQLHYLRGRSGKAARMKEQPVKTADRNRKHPWVSAQPVPTKAEPKPAAAKAETKPDAPDQPKTQATDAPKAK